ncbi:hypothetical protein [Yoonia sp. 2307UL14-13]|uniref:hypothetical protein n=1 Tax=Yoonia sp. 2307UL14-13 TaxID=3126506 RepID=UPI00309BB038
MKNGFQYGVLMVAGFLGACTELQNELAGRDPSLLRTVPEGVISIAAPNQNLDEVRINPADGCYEYLYRGPVETTFLPLRTPDGRPICNPKEESPTEAA